MINLKVLPAGFDDVDRLEIATPCEVPWDSLVGDDRVRHCGRCRQNVYNIEALPRAEAMRLIGRGEGRLCLRIFRRPDGTVVTADCWSRLRAARRKGVLTFLAVLIVAGWAELAVMVVGLAGLRRLTAGPRMGAPAPPAESLLLSRPHMREMGLGIGQARHFTGAHLPPNRQPPARARKWETRTMGEAPPIKVQ